MTKRPAYLIHADELRTALAEIQPCPDCTGGLGIHIEGDGEWDPVQVHHAPCPATTGRPKLTAVPDHTQPEPDAESDVTP